MQETNIKKITLEVSNDCWKKLKILSIQKEISLQDCVKDILEKSMMKKNLLEEDIYK